jgi:hypothetical protein
LEKSLKSKFYDDKKFPISSLISHTNKDIINAYYGGIVDVYKPEMKEGYYYDVNSLYPYAM